MSKKTRIEITRESFLKMRGGKLISIEAYILAFIVLIILTMMKNASPIISLIIAVIIGFVFPILVGTFKSLAWLVAILFSLVWALLTFTIVSAIANDTVFIELISGVISFIISFFVHKHYSGLSFQRIRKRNNNKQLISSKEPTYEVVNFCPKCGRRIRTIDGRCNSCDKQ